MMTDSDKSIPIIRFTSIDQAYKYLDWWKSVLFLNNWIIKLNLVEPHELDDSTGHICMNLEGYTAVIDIIDPNEDPDYQVDSRITKFVAEQTLVHELLHLKYNTLDNDSTYEGRFLEMIQHRYLDQMATSLIMAKYNLDLSWFKNF
jgi:hypothetical protein